MDVICLIFALVGVNCISKVHCVNNSQHFHTTIGKRLPNAFQTVTKVSKIGCVSLCANYNNVSRECQFSSSFHVEISVLAIADNAWKIYSKQDWAIVFRGTQGIGGNLHTTWTLGSSITTNDVTCMTTDVNSCGQHYRNPIIDSWTSIGLSQVKYAFYKNGNEVAYVIFDGSGSDLTNWFTPSRILDSSWADLKTQTFNIFSIIGDDPGRQFYINHAYGRCPADMTYMLALVTQMYSCSYDIQTSYPQFLYSNRNTFGYPESMTGIDIADTMAVFIR